MKRVKFVMNNGNEYECRESQCEVIDDIVVISIKPNPQKLIIGKQIQLKKELISELIKYD